MRIIDVILLHPEILLSRDSIIDLFTESELRTREEAETSGLLTLGKLFMEDGKTFMVSGITDGTISDTVQITDTKRLNPTDELVLKKGMIKNYEGEPLSTTVGRFLLNYTLLVIPFGDAITYVNDKPWSTGTIEKLIVKATVAGKIESNAVYRYIDNAYHLSSYNDFFVPALSEKAITASPEVSKLREELLLKYADKLKDPNTMNIIENELIKMDREFLQGDVSNGFLIKSKNYEVHRKRMFLLLGMMETFGDAERGFNFGTTNLNDGMKLEELPLLANDARRGSYGRGKDTAKGGAEGKFIGRNFQDAKINMDDCGDMRGLPITLTRYNKDHFIHRTIIDKDRLVELTPDNLDRYIDRTVNLRSPMYCQAKFGHCYTCMDSRFKKVGIKMLNISPISISSTLLNISMQSMHGTKVSTINIDNLNMFVS